jgi:methionine-rich copper-binding protein CopC
MLAPPAVCNFVVSDRYSGPYPPNNAAMFAITSSPPADNGCVTAAAATFAMPTDEPIPARSAAAIATE